MIVPYAPGGATDVLARPIAQRLSEQVGQPVIVENRPGANATIGADQVAKSPPDGYVFFLGSIVHYMVPFFSKNVPYDPVKDFTPIAQVAVVPNVLAVSPSLPIHSVKELIDYAKKSGAKLHYGTTGTGSTHHLGGIFLAQTTGIALEHVPYKGGNPAIQDVLSGSIPLVILTATTVMPQVNNGKLRALGLIENRRFDAVPGVPTIGETRAGLRRAGHLVRRDGPRRHAAPGGGEAERRDQEGDHHARDPRPAGVGRVRGGRREHARGVRGDDPERRRSVPPDRDHGRHQTRMTGPHRETRMTLLRITLAALLAAPLVALGQAYPTKPIRLIVPFAPGGGVDNFARPLAQKLTEQLGQQVVVDNRPGASSIIGSALVAKARSPTATRCSARSIRRSTSRR